MNTTHPLRLATGSHSAGSGKGCAMNVISWENGDTTITDLPACADVVLAKIVQRVNDTICTHRTGDLLCPACSILVLDLAHRTVGTGTHPLTPLDRYRVWVWVAADQARQVAHLNNNPRAMAAIVAAETWSESPNDVNASYAQNAGVYANAAAADGVRTPRAYASAKVINSAIATTAAAHAAYTAAYTYDATTAAAHAAYTAACSANAVYIAESTANAAHAKLELAHRAIDVWIERAQFTPTTTSTEVTEAAIECMLATT